VVILILILDDAITKYLDRSPSLLLRIICKNACLISPMIPMGTVGNATVSPKIPKVN